MLNNNTSALSELAAHLGAGAVTTNQSKIEPLLKNTSEFAFRDITAVFQPSSVADVVKIVEVAGQYSLPLYPYSTGKNWGLGSKLPVTDGCALVDLGLLKTIREVNVEQHYAIIEPGVSQLQLSTYLRENNIPLMLNSTSSSPLTSIVGNMLERGTGFHHHRAEDIRGLEVVTGAGELLKTGFWHYGESQRPVHHYKYGIGPSLSDLFTQSNFGIVTAVVVNLVPKPEAISMLWCTFTEDNLLEVIDTLSECYKHGLLRNSIHIGNDNRMKITADKDKPPLWTAMGSITGTKRLVEFLKGEVGGKLQKFCQSIDFYSDDNLPKNEHIHAIYEVHKGIPSEVLLKAMYKSVGETIREDEFNIDNGRYGMLCCLPVLPMTGKYVIEALQIIEEGFKKFGLLPAITFNPMNEDYLESVINIYFDRSDKAQIDNAHTCNSELHATLFKAGYRFYRVDIEIMETIKDNNSPFWKTTESIKKALDPHGIIAPKRYNVC